MSVLDLGVLNTLHGLLGDKLKRIVGVFAQQLAATVAELEATYAAGQWPELVGRAHAIKGSCANMGAAELAALATAIERAAKQGDTAALAEPMGALPATTAATLEALRAQGYWTD